MTVATRRATYTKDSGETSDRVLILDGKAATLNALDVTELSESERATLTQLMQDYQTNVVAPAMSNIPTFAKFVDGKVPAGLIKYRSFKSSGLRFTD